MVYRVISMDGGGLMGVTTSVILSRLTEKCPNLIENTNLFAGTSVGAITACSLSNGISPKDSVELFREFGSKVFTNKLLRKITAYLGLTALYDNISLRTILLNNFGDKKLRDLNKPVLITAFNLCDTKKPKRWKPKIYHSLTSTRTDKEENVVDVLMKSTAAPIFFPSYNGFVDGALTANNPTMMAFAQTQDERCTGFPVPIQDVRILSLGRIINSYIEGSRLDWGYLKWASPLVSILFSRDVFTIDFECRKILKSNYIRSNVILRDDISLDDPSIIDELIEIANQTDISNIVNWLEKNWN